MPHTLFPSVNCSDTTWSRGGYAPYTFPFGQLLRHHGAEGASPPTLFPSVNCSDTTWSGGGYAPYTFPFGQLLRQHGAPYTFPFSQMHNLQLTYSY